MSIVRLVYRKPFPLSFSIEFLFNQLLDVYISYMLDVEKVELPYHSNSILGRIKNLFFLGKFKGGLIHITGDVHYAILGTRKCKRLLTIHDLAFMDNKGRMAYSIYKWFWIVLPVRYSHKVTVISEATKQELLKYVPSEVDKIEVVYDFVDEVYKPIDRHFNELKPRILHVGTKFNKNLKRTVLALEHISCTLVIIGKVPEDIRTLMNKKNIRYESLYKISAEEVLAQYQKADLLSYVSTKEGFGMPILEAQGTGLPVITSNCSAMPEIAGDGALLVDPYDVQAIKSGIMKLIDNANLRNNLVMRGYQNVKRFSKEKVAKDYMRIYNELLNN